MTTRPTDEEMDRCERMLTGCTCHTGFSGRGLTDPNCMACNLGSEVIDTFKAMRAELTERQAARDGVTSEMVETACVGYNQAMRNAGYNDETDDGLSYASPMAMRAALQSIAQPVRVPDVLSFQFENYEWSKEALLQHHSYVQGWNDCREAMLSSLQPQQAVPDGWWVAIEDPQDANEIVMSWNAADGNNGEVARTEANQWINDQLNPGNFSLKFVSAAQAYNGKKEG